MGLDASVNVSANANAIDRLAERMGVPLERG
jgi:hypothetical protein